MQFTNFCKKGYTIEVSFCTGVLKTFHCRTDTPLVCTKHPTKSSGLAICPLAMGGGGAGPIPASRPRSRPGNGSGRVRAHLGEGWRSWLRRRSCQRGVRRRPAAAAATARGSGEKKRMDDNVRPGEVLRVLGREWDGRPAAGVSGAASSPAAAAMEGGGSGGAQRGKMAAFK
jgi:hypothetical protein